MPPSRRRVLHPQVQRRYKKRQRGVSSAQLQQRLDEAEAPLPRLATGFRQVVPIDKLRTRKPPGGLGGLGPVPAPPAFEALPATRPASMVVVEVVTYTELRDGPALTGQGLLVKHGLLRLL